MPNITALQEKEIKMNANNGTHMLYKQSVQDFEIIQSVFLVRLSRLSGGAAVAQLV